MLHSRSEGICLPSAREWSAYFRDGETTAYQNPEKAADAVVPPPLSQEDGATLVPQQFLVVRLESGPGRDYLSE